MMTERFEDKSKRNKKERIYRSTKRIIRKYIPKEIRESPIKNLEETREGEDTINSEDLKKRLFFLKGCTAVYNKWKVLISQAKEELRILRRELPSHISYIESVPKRLDHLKGLLEFKKLLQRREGEDGSLKEGERDLMESLKFVEPFLKHSIEDELITQDNSKDRSIVLSTRIEELENFIQDFEPKVKILREFLDNEFKKIRIKRNSNLRKLFSQE